MLKWEFIKRILICFGLFLISNFSGTQVLKVNTLRILESSGMNLDKELSTILVTSILLFGNSALLFSIDRVGRRRCLLISFSLLVISYTVLGAFVYITESMSVASSSIEIVTLEEANSTIAHHFEPE